jgi:rod shape-determining protein MreC
LVVVFILVVAGVFYVSNTKDPHEQHALDRAVIRVSAPFQWVVVKTVGGVKHVWARYFALYQAQQENVRLRIENERLESELAYREEERLENERLRAMLGVRDKSSSLNMVYASIVGASPSVLFQSFRVDVGRHHGVKTGAPVLNYEGLIGRVASLGEYYADVMLLLDANSSLDVLVQRTRDGARVRGTGGEHEMQLEVQYLARTADVEPGDVLITSGVGNVFPKGIRVGKVRSVQRRAFGLYQYATVTPSVNFGRLESVMVVRGEWNKADVFQDSAQAEDAPQTEVTEATPPVESLEPAAQPSAVQVKPVLPGVPVPSPNVPQKPVVPLDPPVAGANPEE